MAAIIGKKELLCQYYNYDNKLYFTPYEINYD